MNKPCAHPACPVLIPIRSGRYCLAHTKPERDYKREAQTRAESSEENLMNVKFRSSQQWRELRNHKLRINPLCEDPHGWHKRYNTTETARQVHHIKPLATHFHLRADLDNLMSICYRCHAEFNRQERKASLDE